MSGVFRAMSSTTGLPLEIILDILKKNNMVVSWKDFIDSSLKEGWKWKTITERISYSVNEIYGARYRDIIMRAVQYYASLEK